MQKPIIFSGIQPSGNLTIGNYLGAIKNWVTLQEDYHSYYCVVDMHAITVPQVAKDLRRKSLEVLAIYLAAGIDPEKCTVFIQSHVPTHAELSWVLSTMTYMGELNRMTQFKEKSKNKAENLNAGLYTYPILMASDILLYQTNLVPVGEDQKQHLELARDLAQRFNSRYSDTFIIPEPFIAKTGARIMGLQNPTAKMSKSSDMEQDRIGILDSPDSIRSKIKRAVTDSIGTVQNNKDQAGIYNLLQIHSSFSQEDPDQIVERFNNQGYGTFKEEVAEVIIEGLRPIQTQFNHLMQDTTYLESIYAQGAERAYRQSRKVLSKVYRKVGFVAR